MNKETETSYLQNIEESVFDEDKIVTYKWLSKYLGLHVNISKQLLYTYAKNCPRRNEISLTYLVAGIPKNGGVEMYVVRESDLEHAKEGLQRITSEHVYSIQKVPTLTDLNVLYTADKAESFESEDNTKFSSIEFDYGKRDDSFFEKLKAKTAVAAVVKTEAPSSVKVKASQPENKANKDSGAAVINGTKVSEENTADKDGSKKVMVPSMFANTKAAATNKKVNNAKAIGAPSKTSKQTGLAAFLSKAQLAKPKEENAVQENNKHEDIKDAKSDEKNNKEVHRSDENIVGISDEMEVEVIKSEKENCLKQENSKSSVKKNTGVVKEKKNETKKGNKRPKKSNKEDSLAKKRRRIIVMDSDSDSSEESVHSERELTPPRPSTPPEDDDDVISATPELTTKHQRRRFVNKSYVDNDGYIVTKKEYIFEDCSDTEKGESEKQMETKGESTRTKSKSPQNESSKEEDTESQKEDSVSPHKNKNNVASKKKPAPAKSTKNSKKSSPRKASSPKKNNQPSITNFFSKKT